MLTLDQLMQPLTRDQVLAALLSAAQGVGQVSQSGAGGLPAAGTGHIAVTGVPVGALAYDVVLKVISSGQTSALQIQYSLDGGATWSALQNAAGQSPWALALNGYPAYALPNLVTGLTATFSDGYPPITGSWVGGETYAFTAVPSTLAVDDWEEGGNARTILEADAQVDSDLSALIANVTGGGLLQYSSLGWLDLLAENVYGLTRKQAIATTGAVELACAASAGPYSIVPRQLWFQGAGGNLYTNVDGGTLPSGESIILRVAAEAPGAAYDDAGGTVTLLSTPLPGVTVDNVLGVTLGAPPWLASHTYPPAGVDARGVLCAPGNGYIYVVQQQGVSAAVQPVWPLQIGQTVVDGTVTWMCLQVDQSGQSYVPATAVDATGLAFAAGKVGLVPASVVVLVTTGGTEQQLALQISTDAGKTFGALTLAPVDQNGVALGTWAANTVYVASVSEVVPVTWNGYYFLCTAGGTSGSSEPVWAAAVGATTNDNGVVWTCVGKYYASAPVYGGGLGGPNLNGNLVLFFQGTAAGSFVAGDAYLFDTDWISQYGADAETDGALRLRCQQQWATLASGAPASQIEAWAKAASAEVVAAYAVADVAADGSIDLYIAGAEGAVSASAIAAVTNYVAARLPLGTSLHNNVAISASVCAATLSGTVYVAAASQATAQRTIASALDALANEAGINGTIYLSQIVQAIQGAAGVRNADSVSIAVTSGYGNISAGDLVLTGGAFAQLTSSLTMIPI